MLLKENRSTFMLACSLLALGVFAYWPALRGFFLSDDFVHVQYLQHMDEDIYILLKNFWSNWLDVPTTLFYRPLISVTLYLDHVVWGWRPLGYHLTNLLMHAGNGILVFLLAQRLAADRSGTRPLLLPFMGAALFLIWPLHLEAVYWIIGRVDVQVTFFYLLSTYLFVRHAADAGKRAWLVGSLLSFVAALMSKEPAVTLPAVLAAYGFFILCPGQLAIFRRAVQALRVTAAFWGVLALYFVWRWHVLGTFGGGYTGSDNDYFSADYWGRWKTLVYLLAPINHVWPPSASHQHAAALLFLLGWCLIAMAIFRVSSPGKSGRVWFGLITFVLSLLPLAPVFHIASDLQSSRFLYLPAAFLWITVASAGGVRRDAAVSIAMRAGVAALGLLIALSAYQLRLNLQPWMQASQDVKLLSVNLDGIATERERNPAAGRLLVLAGIPDSFYGAQFLRNGYGGFLGAVFHARPINDVLPLTDDNRTGVMPIHAKNLAAGASELLYGVYRYIPGEGFRRVAIEQKPAAGAGPVACPAQMDGIVARRKLSDMAGEDDHWRVAGPDPSVVFAVADCQAGAIDALRLSFAYTPAASANTAGNTMQVFWRGATAAFSEDRSMTIPVIADGAMHAYTLPVKTSAAWEREGELGEIRVDFPGQPGGHVTFGQASFLLSSEREVFPQYSGARLEALDVSRISGTAFDPQRGILTLDIQRRDEFLLLPRDAWNPVHGDLITIRMRVSGTKKPLGKAKLYWTTDKAPEFSEDKSASFSVQADGQWHSYAIPLKYLPAWWTNGGGQQLRLNPYYGRAKVELDLISIGQTLPLPQLTLLDDVQGAQVRNIKNAAVFRRVGHSSAGVVQLAYQALDGYANSILEISPQPFDNPNLPAEQNTLELKLVLPGKNGVVRLDSSQFHGPGMRYLRLVSLDSSGHPTGFASDPVALLVED